MDTRTEMPEWLTVGEVARHFRVSPRTVARWAASGAIRSQRVGPGARLIRIHCSALDAGHISEAS
ncbi:helix-turn-helix domain-containing protein [Streptomyces sp. NPDC012693]|uniref:helix-turn-helix domain-containing protein n=1 Tax=Streptomyces sp. NPDC012693 TaxID=3364844 RepID=UPI0036BCEB90